MSSAQPDNNAPSTPVSAPTPVSEGPPWRASPRPIDERNMSSADARLVVRLIQCPICSRPLSDPCTLPCGNTLCRTCIPVADLRTGGMSYPTTTERMRHGFFFCPFRDCETEHPAEHYSVNVVLSRAVTSAKTAYHGGRQAAIESGLVTRLAALSLTGADASASESAPKQELPGGWLLAAFLMAEKGDLAYHVELEFETKLQSQALVDLDVAVMEPLKAATRPEMDCQVCFDIFSDPITTPCGHTFCRPCLQRTLDHGRLCPICRRRLTIDPMGHPSACPSNELLKRITAAFWIDLVEARRSAVPADAGSCDAIFDLPIFICTLAFPSMPTFLHIFEPRYRLMIRRTIDDNRTFGMVLPRGDNGAVDLGTELRITNFEFFADGRILLETKGASRFRILESSTRDGYTVARAQRINDVSLAEEEQLEALETAEQRPSIGLEEEDEEEQQRPPPAPRPRFRVPSGMADLQMMPTRELMDFAADYVQRMRVCSVRWLRTRTLEVYGECPGDAAVFPWWFANVLPVSEDEKYRLLGTTSVRERLKICCGWILEWEGDLNW